MSSNTLKQLIQEMGNVKRIVHVGSDDKKRNKERASYRRLGLETLFLGPRISEGGAEEADVVDCLIREHENTTAFWRLNVDGGDSDSVLEPIHPHYLARGGPRREEHACRTLDAICIERTFTPDIIVLDVQGAELLVLRGATKTLKDTKIIKAEVTYEDAGFDNGRSNPLYKDAPLFDEITDWLKARGFILVTHEPSETKKVKCSSCRSKSMPKCNHSYGNAFYKRVDRI